jgi:hypothetical protein
MKVSEDGFSISPRRGKVEVDKRIPSKNPNFEKGVII